MKKVLLAVCVMVLASGVVPALAESKIALVNVREVLTKCDAGVKAVGDMRTMFAARQQKLNEMKQDAMALQEQLKAKSPDAAQKSPELEAKVRKFAEEEAQLRKDIAAEEETRLKPILERITGVVRAYGQEKKLAGIQDRALFMYYESSMDVTEEILKRVNQAK